MTRKRDMSLREFDAALAKYGFASDEYGMGYVTHSGEVKRVAHVKVNGKVRRRASLAALGRAIADDPDMDTEV